MRAFDKNHRATPRVAFSCRRRVGVSRFRRVYASVNPAIKPYGVWPSFTRIWRNQHRTCDIADCARRHRLDRMHGSQLIDASW